MLYHWQVEEKKTGVESLHNIPEREESLENIYQNFFFKDAFKPAKEVIRPKENSDPNVPILVLHEYVFKIQTHIRQFPLSSWKD